MAKKILLVDDEEDLVSMVKLRLEAMGFDVVTAGDGEEGLAKAKGENPDLMLLDLMLPKMNGITVCQTLKKDEQFRKIPIIMFTAKAQELDKEQGNAAGADGYISKPFEPKILMEKINQLIAGSA